MLVHNTVLGSGTFFRAHGLARGLTRRGHQVTLVGASRQAGLATKTTVLNGVEIVEPACLLPHRLRHAGLCPLDLLTRIRLVGSQDYDLVHGFEHRPTVLIPALLTANRQRTPYIHDWADLWGWQGIAGQRGLLSRFTLGALDAALEPKVPWMADGVTVVNSYLAERLLQAGIPAERLRIIPPGSSPEPEPPIPVSEARQVWGLPLGAPIVAYVGISTYDDDLVVEVWRLLKPAVPGLVLLLGGQVAGRTWRRLALDIQAGSIRLLGMLPPDQIHGALSAADVLLLPFTGRGINLGRFPNRIGEYLAANRPIVTNATGDLGKLVTAHSLGAAVADDPLLFAEAVAELFASPQAARECGLRARQLAEGTMNWDHHAQAVESLYLEVIGAKGGSADTAAPATPPA